MFKLLLLFSLILIGCSTQKFSYIKYSEYKKCITIERELLNKYSNPDTVQKSPRIKISEWYLKEKTIIFKKFISGSCNLKIIYNGG